MRPGDGHLTTCDVSSLCNQLGHVFDTVGSWRLVPQKWETCFDTQTRNIGFSHRTLHHPDKSAFFIEWNSSPLGPLFIPMLCQSLSMETPSHDYLPSITTTCSRGKIIIFTLFGKRSNSSLVGGATVTHESTRAGMGGNLRHTGTSWMKSTK